jgi:ring-1,2-phenylacetyl-CoA epoxidase subunit PaaC
MTSGPGTPSPAPSVVPAPRETPNALFEYLLRLGDDRLVLGHRLSEWCGHGPILEEDIALANVALDLLGQATMFLRLAGEVEGMGRDEDALAYFREAVEFRNCQLVELPKGDFAYTIARQFLFDVYAVVLLDALTGSTNASIAAIAAKSLKEAKYHVRHSGEWMLKLGDGTDESHRRAQQALDDLWRFTAELFTADAIDRELQAAGVAPDLTALAPSWDALVRDVLERATLTVPTLAPRATTVRGGRTGAHTEFLGHLLAEMHIIARSHPGATW